MRDKNNELSIYMVTVQKRNKAVLLTNAVSAYKRSCDLVFNYLSLPTRLPDTLNAVMYEDTWPEYKQLQTPMKRLAPENEDEINKRSKTEPKNEQIYRYRVDADRIAMFQTNDKALVEQFVVNIQKYAVVAWGMIEQLLERNRNPFRLTPLFTHGCTAAEWLNNVIAGADVATMAVSIGKHEEHMFQEILYKNNEKKFVVARRFGGTPLVFLNDPELERPVKDCPEAFMTALFLYLYDGGTKGTMQIMDASYLKFCLLEPTVRPIICEENKQMAAVKYKRVLVDVTDGRTQEEILNQFETVEDLATHLIVDQVELKFDIPTVYVHPENQRVIKSANRVCRWTNLTINPPAQYYVKDAHIRQALKLSSGEVEIAAVNALVDEGGLSFIQTVFMFSDCAVSFTDDELKNTFSDHWDNLVQNGRLNLNFLKEITTRLELRQRYPDYVQINTAIVYGGGKFHANDDQSLGLLKSLNEQLQLVQTSDAPLVSNLFTVNLDLVPYLITASNGKLALPLQQAKTVQKNLGFLLKSVLQDAFTTGSWKHLTVACNIAATLQVAFENKNTYWNEFEQFWEFEQNRKKSTTLVPLYLTQNTDPRLFIHYSKGHGCVVFEIKDDAVEQRVDLTSYCNNYDVEQLIKSPLRKDGNFIVFILYLVHTKKTENKILYDDVLRVCKQNLLFLASLYNLNFTDADSFAVFDSNAGEDLLNYFVEKTFFSQRKSYGFSTPVNTAVVMKEITNNEKNLNETISTGNGVLFVKNTTIPVLYVYNSVKADDLLYTTLFDMWLASDNGCVGFFNLSIESDMETESGFKPHYLTLVYTPELFNVPLPEPVCQYGNGGIRQQQNQRLSDTHRKLIKWAVDLDLTVEDVFDVVSSHTMTLLRYKNNTNKRFSINYFDQGTLNNTLLICNEDIMKKITPKRHLYYASLQVSNQEFVLLFSRKIIR